MAVLIIIALSIGVMVIADYRKKVNKTITVKIAFAKKNADETYCDISAYSIVKNILEKVLHKSNRVREQINDVDAGELEFVHSMIGNISGDLLESGSYHIYRGVLNQTGKELLEIFDRSMLVLSDKIGSHYVDRSYAIQQMKAIRDNIKEIG